MNAPPFTLTNESITVVYDGKTHTVQRGAPQFVALRSAIAEERWDDVPKNLTVVKTLHEWAKGKFTLSNNTFSHEGKELPRDLNQRIVQMATNGEDPTHLFNFWERLQLNPSYRSVTQLWGFLNQKGIPLTEDGSFLAYKSVRQDFKDHHSNTFDNSPGQVHEMPRNQISDDQTVECDAGFHVGALEYAQTFNSDGRIVICKVAPENVVSVPQDHNAQKMRVCKYEIIGNHNGAFLPSTTFKEDEYEEPLETEYNDEDYVREEDQYETEERLYESSNEDEEELEEVDEAEEPKPLEKKRHSKRGYAKFDEMDMSELLAQSLEDLRRYANKGLQIVGASKVPGGKVALVSRILSVRE